MSDTFTEYGVFVDRTSTRQGVYLVKTFRTPSAAKSVAEQSARSYGCPAEVKRRRVTVTEWESA